ncbi:DUF3413 domain-containing protein [Photobacterium profundum]|uniref:Hypothetical hydrolase of alkaline phosphatase superfamily n=1 Tax=Photobacterium profundum 3TCK TaxID=314280 RepID=Q1Z7V1_9GAMM|nr:DUF3413 domain-containing protein [Photobacterium profundum]EAS44762.1 hypothetical hydrolase of alkaline phosphatase superfamily [Photobacterium profundum 3TCK]PSV60743.1 DUF3413 domain-containing protein [Photobacterium profundum]
MVASGNNYKDKVSQLISWGHWFSFFNIIAAMLLGSRYIVHSEWPETLLGQLYLLLSWVGHFGFLVFGLYILIIFPASFLIPSQRLMRFFAVLVGTIGLTVLLLDTHAYESISLHLSPLVWDLLLSGEKTDLNARWQYLFIVVPIIFLLQLILSEWLWRKLRKLTRKHVGVPIAIVFGMSFLGSHLLYIWADANLYHPVTMQRSNFPLSYPMTAKSFMEKHGLLDLQDYAKRSAEQGLSESQRIRYPTEKLNFDGLGTGQNLLVVMVDNLRSDMVNNKTMPNLFAFAKQNVNYTNHYSANNDNMVGIFGLFYGLPGGYVNSVRAEGTTPILLNTLEKRGYDFGLFSGNQFKSSIYSQAIFNDKQLEEQLSKKSEQKTNDNLAIADWTTWLGEQNDNPWFSYLELTSVEEFEEGGDYVPQFTPSLGTVKINTVGVDSNLLFKNSYRNAAYHVDQQIADILDELERKQVLDNTIVIITANHGTEFNETGTNSWGADTNYSQYQLKVPMVIHWPQQAPAQIERITSHLDVVPTLMESLLEVASAPTTYSSGTNLFEKDPSRRWILAGDSRDIVMIQKNSTTVVDKYGNYRVYDENYKLMSEGKPRLSTLMQVMNELKRFYQPN